MLPTTLTHNNDMQPTALLVHCQYHHPRHRTHIRRRRRRRRHLHQDAQPTRTAMVLVLASSGRVFAVCETAHRYTVHLPCARGHLVCRHLGVGHSKRRRFRMLRCCTSLRYGNATPSRPWMDRGTLRIHPLWTSVRENLFIDAAHALSGSPFAYLHDTRSYPAQHCCHGYPLVSSAALLPRLLLSTAPVSPPRARANQ